LKLPGQRNKNTKGMKKVCGTHGIPSVNKYTHYGNPRESREETKAKTNFKKETDNLPNLGREMNI
jgi:hypothetical protein